MKRFKDCILLCNARQNPIDLLQIVKAECDKQGMKSDINTSFAEHDIMWVIVCFEQYPASKLILHASEDKKGVAILNIVPLPQSRVSSFEIPMYNKVLDKFRDTVFKIIASDNGNKIKENTEDYSIEEIIPKSFPKLQTWLSFYPLSHHPNDEHRWYDFLIALLDNNERVSSSVLSEYIKEKHQWSDSDLFDLELRFESQMDLLEYFVDRR